MANEKGVWRTIGGRRVFIKEGQDLASAMKESGKFKSAKKGTTKKEMTAQETSNEDISVSYYDENGEKKTAKYNELKEKAKESFNKNQEKIKKMTDEIGIGKKELENNATDKDKVLEDFKNSDGSKENFEKALNKISEMEYNNEINPDEYKESISKIQKEYVEKNRKANEPMEKRLEKQNRYTESESIKEVKDKYMPERTKAVSQYQNGEIDRNELMKRFDGNEQRMKETFEQMGYTAPTKENIDRANKKHEEFMSGLKDKDSKTKETKQRDLSTENIKKMSDGELKETYEKMKADYYSSKDFYDFGTENKLEELQNEISSRETSSNKELASNSGQEKINDNLKVMNYNGTYIVTDKGANIGEFKTQAEAEKFAQSKAGNQKMNEAIRSRGKSKVEEDDLPKHTEIKTQGTSNRKEVSDNIQAHILDYYTEDYTGENISPAEAFVRQMDAMGESNMWRAGQKIAEGGSYLIYNGDMADFLDELKINPKGKTFSEDKAFNMYTSLIGRESAKLYDRIQKNSYKKYMKAHPLSKMSFEEFKDMNKK